MDTSVAQDAPDVDEIQSAKIYPGVENIRCAIIDGTMWLSVRDIAIILGDVANYTRTLVNPIFKTNDKFMIKFYIAEGPFAKRRGKLLMMTKLAAIAYTSLKLNTSDKATALLADLTRDVD